MIGAGPSPRPSCAIALYSKATKVTRKLSLETPEQSMPRARRQAPPGRADRAGDVPNSKRMMGGFPQRTARRESWEQTLEARSQTNRIRAKAGSAPEYGCAVFYRRPGGRRQKPARNLQLPVLKAKSLARLHPPGLSSLVINPEEKYSILESGISFLNRKHRDIP